MPSEEIPTTVHDIHLDHILTPERAFWIERVKANPSSIHWELIEQEKIEAIPVLKGLWTERSRSGSHRKIDNAGQQK